MLNKNNTRIELQNVRRFDWVFVVVGRKSAGDHKNANFMLDDICHARFLQVIRKLVK